MMKYIDIHTHYNSAINYDYNKSIYVFNLKIGDIDFDIEKNINFEYISLGIHPWEISDEYKNKDYLEKKILHLKNQLQFNNVLALGEIGIDRAINTELQLQKNLFIQQITMNEKFNKPVIIHSVRSHSDLLAIKKKYVYQKWVFHGFSGSIPMALQLIKANCFLSLGPAIFKKTEWTRNFIHQIPLTSIFLETDVQVNYSIEDMYTKIAEILRMDIENLKKAIYDNYCFLTNKK